MEEAVRERCMGFKLWKAGGSRVAHNTTTRACIRTVHKARSEVEIAL